MTAAKIRHSTLKYMRNVFYPDISPRIDWMGFEITDDNKPTYHHIVKKEFLKKEKKSTSATIENGAYLGKRSHELLHEIEALDADLYTCWNDLFLLINKMRIHPIEDVWDMIYQLKDISLELVESNNKGKKHHKHKK